MIRNLGIYGLHLRPFAHTAVWNPHRSATISSPCDRADRPALSMMQPQHLRFQGSLDERENKVH